MVLGEFSVLFTVRDSPNSICYRVDGLLIALAYYLMPLPEVVFLRDISDLESPIVLLLLGDLLCLSCV